MGTYLTDLADVCRAAGLVVIECDGWQERGRGGAGGDSTNGYESGSPSHVIVHHTASGPSSDGWPDVNYCLNHEDSPVGNLYLSRVPEVFVMAGGAANTNGSGHDTCGLVPDDSMNSRSIAIEAGNGGTGEPWAPAQQDSYVRLVRALCDAYGIGVEQVHSHFEWAPGRKIDPAGESAYASGGAMWNMDAFRTDVDTGDVTPAPIPPEPTPGPEPAPPSGWTCPPFPGTGDYGCTYDTCRAWQDAMILNGIITDNPANHDGVWGDGMHGACFDMQRSWGWSDADGVGGSHTWPHLRSRDVAPCPTCGG